MSQIIWKESYSIGINAIDEQHKNLIERLMKKEATLTIIRMASKDRLIIISQAAFSWLTDNYLQQVCRHKPRLKVLKRQIQLQTFRQVCSH